MKVSSILAVGATVALAAAAPNKRTQCTETPICGLDYDTGSAIVDGFGSLLSAFQESTATALLAETGFTDTSSSINFLSGLPLNDVTFPNRQAFIAGQGTQPPIGFEVLGIDAISCNTEKSGVIAFRWLASVGQNKTGGAKGINVLYVSHCGDESKGVEGAKGWVIDTVFSEFNSAVWVQEFGGQCALPARPSMLFKA